MNIHEGWPTEEMIEAGFNAYHSHLMNSFVINSRTAFAQALQAALEAAPTPETTCLFPLIDAQFETVEKGITGTTSAPVKRVEMRDDGSYTVIIDHWPAPTPLAAKRPHWNTDGGWQCTNCGKGITHHEGQVFCPTPPAQEYSCPCGLGDKPCPDPATGKPLCDDTPAQEDTPVAWLYEHDGMIHASNHPPIITTEKWANCKEPWSETPLYTRPADDKPKGTPVGASDGCETRVARYYTAADDKLRNRISQHLAIVHRDGGQHEEAVGTEQTINDATNVIRKLRKAAEEASELLNDLLKDGLIIGYLPGIAAKSVQKKLHAALEGK